MKKLLILLPALLCACAHSKAKDPALAQPEAVTAEGLAVHDPKNLAAGRTAAVLDAQRSALRRAAELYLEDDYRESGLAALESGPLKTPQAYLARYKVLSEGAEGGYYRVSVKAWVLAAKLGAALRGSVPAAAGRARAALVASETPAGDAFAAAFAAALGRRSLLALEEFEFAKRRPLPEGDEALLAAAAAEGADVLLVASASAYASGAALNAGFFPARADASVKIYDAGSGRLLAEVSRQGSGIDSSQAGSFSKALASAAELLAQEAAARADRLVRPEAAIAVRVSGIAGLEALEKLKSQLQRLDLKRLRLERYADGVAVFQAVPRRPDPQELASAILRGDATGLQLVGVGASEVRFTSGW